jgi:hypothetical protein
MAWGLVPTANGRNFGTNTNTTTLALVQCHRHRLGNIEGPNAPLAMQEL